MKDELTRIQGLWVLAGEWIRPASRVTVLLEILKGNPQREAEKSMPRCRMLKEKAGQKGFEKEKRGDAGLY